MFCFWRIGIFWWGKKKKNPFLSENFLWALAAATAAERSQQPRGEAGQRLGRYPRASQLTPEVPTTAEVSGRILLFSSTAACQEVGAGPKTTIPSALLPPALVFRQKRWLHTTRSRNKHYNIFRASQQPSLPPKKPSLDHQQAGNALRVGVPRVSVLHPPSSYPSAAIQRWWHRSPPGSCWWGVPGCLPPSGCGVPCPTSPANPQTPVAAHRGSSKL